ncbi:pectinesterase family protein [[Clostridium] fimetarium]|uniref:Pectin methylesterase n=1 Tax=[Clostridium] fimetarium TaxID=99656 RepID=A0A1I0M139_9FIRM|nr:pectinesterase family protein [[Clostridium] fimetarium]SEV82127.1 Pectin methylesterase [[Clostridium] fimetarium]
MKSKNRKKFLSIVLTVCMILGTIPFTGATKVLAADGAVATNPLTTIWKTAEIGAHATATPATAGSYTYDSVAKTVSIVGAGAKFDKSAGVDDLYYAYFAAKGDITIQAKITPTGTTAGQVGVLVRNSEEVGATSAAIYADYGNKGQIRYGYHKASTGGGASALNTAITSASPDIYVKIEISGETAKFYVSTTADFAGVVAKSQPITGLDAKQIGLFATAGTTAVFSDVKVTSVNTADGITIKKTVFDSSIGELIPTFSNSKAYSGTYDSDTVFASSADGNILNVDNKKGAVKGSIRDDKQTDYLLFPATTSNYTISAQVNMSRLDTGTDKFGVAVGQFAVPSGTYKPMAMDIVQTNKTFVTQHNFTTSGAGVNGGDPKTAANAVIVGKDYILSYQKTSGNTSIMKTLDASGTILASNGTATLPAFDLTQCYASLQNGKSVQYGLAFAGVTAQISNITLTDIDGYIVYDQNDYYIAVGVAPVVTTIDSAVVTQLRDAINLSWTVTEGKGNISYVILVSKDGGAYTPAGISKVTNFSYKPTADGTYTFKVYGKAGELSSVDSAQISAQVPYVTPLSQTILTATGTDKKIDLAWTAVTGATSYDLYKTDGQGEAIKWSLVKSFGTSELVYSDTDVTNENPYYYTILAKNDTNTSNVSVIQQALPTPGHVGTYVYEAAAAKFTITSKSNDTVTARKASIAGTVDKAGTLALEVNGKQISSATITANGTFSFDIDLTQYRNDVNLYLTDADGKITRKTFNFIYLEKYNILVDGAFTGTDGDLVNGVPTYKTVSAAVATVPADNAASKVIFIKNGDYNERVEIKSPYVSLLGEDSVKTRIYKSVAVADGSAKDMWTRNCMYVDSTADGFAAENLTIENSYAYSNGTDQQADALCIVADQTTCINIRLIGYQDTLLTDTRVKDASGNYEVTRQYFQKCYITGNVDFIYGAGTSVFSDCDIVARYTSYKPDGCFSAGRTYASTKYGFVFSNCHFLAEAGVAAGSFRMSRPWGADAEAIFINCYLTSAIAAAGYGDMSGNSYLNARFAEYGSYGPGFVVNNDRFLFSPNQAAEYATITVLGDYVNKILPADYTAVNTIISTINALISSQYVDFSAVTAAVAALVFGLDSSEQAKVDAMATSISDAFKALVIKDADYSALTSAIASTEALTATNYITGYPAVSTALTSAKAVATGLKIDSQGIVDTALTNLNSAVATLVLKDADYSALTAAIASAEAHTSSVYTSESYAVVTTAITAAKAVVNGLKIDKQSSIDAAATALTNAVTALVKAPVIIAATGNTEIKLVDPNANIEQGSKFEVKAVTSGEVFEKTATIVNTIATANKLEQFVVFEMDLKNSDGIAVQLKGKVSVSLPIPSGFDLTKAISVFRVETDGTLTKLDTKVVDGKCVFETDHFSTYVIAQVANAVVVTPEVAAVVTPDATPATKTGDTSPITMYMLIMGIAAGTVLYATKKRKIKKVN